MNMEMWAQDTVCQTQQKPVRESFPYTENKPELPGMLIFLSRAQELYMSGIHI